MIAQALMGLVLLTAGTDAPLTWEPPRTFDADAPGLGLPRLQGCDHDVIYNPTKRTPILGPDGEPTPQGWYSHAPQLVVLGEHLIAVWVNHLSDENAGGQRQLARLAHWDDDANALTWADTIVEIAPPPVPMMRRGESSNPDTIDAPYVRCRFEVIGGELFLFGELSAYDGWSDDVRYNHLQPDPIPAAHYRESRDRGAGFRYDIKRDLGFRYVQRWGVVTGRLEPTSPMYRTAEMVARVEVTPGRFKPVVAVDEPYRGAPRLEDAPPAFRDALKGERAGLGSPRYAPGTKNLAADGSRGLAHMTEFQRPDGKWVVVRDHLVNHGRYYAAVKDRHEDDYPPAERTNLFGDVQPVAGSLPDGRVWLVGSDRARRHFYLTLSEDGIHFDRTWLLFHAELRPRPGLGKGTAPNGPQYPAAVAFHGRIVVIYSIAKERIGITQIPFDVLQP